MASSTKRDARRVAVKQWRAKALRLRVDGYTIAQIAKKLGKAASTVHEGLEAEIASIPAEGAKDLRQLHGEQLDAIIRGNLAPAMKGDTRASLAVIQAIKAKAKLFGINAREKLDITGDMTLTDDAHQQLLDRLAKVAGAASQPS